jgi:RNA methyltransferase, TrmH family
LRVSDARSRCVTSAENPQFRALLKLHNSARERRRQGMSLLEGPHLVAAYREHIGAPEKIIVSRSALENREITSLLELDIPQPLVLSDALFRQLSSVVTPTGILAAVKTPTPGTVPESPDACVMLEDVQDPGNLGSILRTAAASGMKEVYLSRMCADAWSPRVLRAGMGAHFVLRIFEGVDLAGLARSYPGRVFAAARDGALQLYSADLRGRVALVFGNEGAGITRDLAEAAHATLAIPMPGHAESLNVAAAAAVCLFERVRQTGAAAS